jgi:catechol 2,3-dioxygenase-like lactoylglutathione lyase family enzyme
MAFAHITMPSRDVRAMVQFFEATLGWTSIERPNNIPFPSAWMAIGPGQELHLLQLDDYAPSPFEREYGRHLAVAYPRSGFDALKERLKTAGAEVIPPIRPTTHERFFFRGPDGYMFEVVEEQS